MVFFFMQRRRRPQDFVRHRGASLGGTVARGLGFMLGGGLRKRESPFNPQNPHHMSFWKKMWLSFWDPRGLEHRKELAAIWEEAQLAAQRAAQARQQGGQE